MPNKKFPNEYTDEELFSFIAQQSNILLNEKLPFEAVTKYSGLISVSLSELQIRKLAKLELLLNRLNLEIQNLDTTTENSSSRQLNSLDELDHALVELNSRIEDLTKSSNNQEEKLDKLDKIMSDLKKETETFRIASDNANKSSTKNTRISIGLVFISLTISGFALFFASHDRSGDLVWEKNQMKHYTELKDEIKRTNELETKIVAAQDSIVKYLKESNELIKLQKVK